MPASQEHITPDTPMGATLVAGGITLRFWAPTAERVRVTFDESDPDGAEDLAGSDGTWTGFFPGVGAGRKYRFHVTGRGQTGFKRDPHARELELYGYPDCDALVVDPAGYEWHDQDWQPPAFDELIVYQFHVGVFSPGEKGRTAKLLDAVQRVPYLAELGVTAVQPLPVVEFQGEWSLGYNGTDLFSPEMDYCLDPDDLPPYLDAVNDLLAARGRGTLKKAELDGQVNQLKAFVDVCHAYGIAVIFDVVYNHAGGGLDPQSLDYVDLPADPGPDNNAYFSAEGWAGGRVFAFHRPEVRSYLIDNATMFLDEYHADGLRFDEVTVIDAKGGWAFCQEMTAALRDRKPSAALIAEYWGEQRLAVLPAPGGMGFDIGYADSLRDAVRGVLADAARGGAGRIGLGRVAVGLQAPTFLGHTWRAYNCLENHDLVLDMDDHRQPRIARLAGGNDARSWYARSRARVATGVLLAAPGTPMLFMGQEFLEDKLWSDSPGRTDRLIWWDGALGADRHMADFLRCTRDLIALRRAVPALRSDDIGVYPPDEENRVLAFRRGDAAVVVLSLNENTLHGYELGFPRPGRWREAFNSDYYDHFPNPWVAGNGGAVDASGTARLTIPANALLVFTSDAVLGAAGASPG